MKNIYRILRTLLFISLLGSNIYSYGQAFTENFDDITTLTGSGWFIQNNSSPVGTISWFQGNNYAAGGPFDAYNGAANAYIGVNFNSTTGSNTISNWLLVPNRTLRNGDVFSFYTRKPTTPSGGTDYPDRLEIRLSTNGASTNVGTTAAGVGDFTTLLLSVNPTLVAGGYPYTWTQYTITISGLPAPTSGRIAFRYFVTSGGPTGSNSDYIGIDNVVYTPYTCPTITVNPSSLSNGTAGSNYSQSLSQTGALGTPSYFITAGALPPGLTLSAAGTISGTPTATGTFNFTVTVSDASGCTGSRAYSITIVCPSNGASLSAFPSLCTNGPLYNLTEGTPAGGFYFGTGVTGGQFDPIAGTQTIYYSFTDAYGCNQSTSQQIVVNIAPVVNLSSFTSVCSNSGTVTLSGGSPASGTWSGVNVSAGTFDPTGGSQLITYSYTDGNGCSASDVENFPVNMAPTVTLSAFTAVCDNSGTQTLLGGSPTGGVWSGTNVSGSSFDPSNGSQQITYTYTDGNGCSASDDENFPVNIAPTVTLSAFTAVCDNSGTQTLSGGSPTGGVWSGTNVSGSTFDPSNGNQLITYTYTDGNGCTASAAEAFLVNISPVVLATANDSVVCSGDFIILHGSGASYYTWDNSVVDGDAFSISASGTYTVTGSDGNGCSNTDDIYITVNQLPAVVAHRTEAAVCSGDSVMLYGSGANNYLWNHSVTDSIAFLPSATLTYKVTGTDLNGCKNIDSTIVTVNLLPSVNITTAPIVVCIDAAPINLAATPAGGAWSGPGVTGNIFTPSTAGTGIKLLIYTYSDANSCSASDSVNMTVNPCSGIDEPLNETALKVYPNPVVDNITFKLLNGLFTNGMIEIYDIIGKKIITLLPNDVSIINVEMSSYAKGTYLYRAYSEDKLLGTGKFVIQ